MPPTDATHHTATANKLFVESLDLAHGPDAERISRGRIGGDDPLVIHHSRSGAPIVDSVEYDFLDGAAPDTVNPSLWRQAQLNNHHGLFQVADRVYQVRGYDISNVSLVEGDRGWIVIDPLTTAETAHTAMDLVREHLGDRPVTGVVYTHSHVDHFGGVLGVASHEELAANDTPIVAPEGFLHEAVFENVIAGPAMLRRAFYMYGAMLPKGPRGQVDCGLGKKVPAGTTGLVAPTHLIGATGEELTIDGVRIVFQFTPDAEAPAEMMFHFPELRALCVAENCTSVMHNLYTPRGALVRDALAWSKYIHESLMLFGDVTDVAFASHNWPRFGADEVREYLRTQRDTYRYLHDQTMRLANRGHVPTEIAEELDLPASLAGEFGNRGYYGTVSHNSKAVYQRYLGWFDGNPANLEPLPPVPAGAKYVEYMGGVDAVLDRARRDFDAGEYRWVAQVLNHLVFAQPARCDVRELQAATLEQLGYAAESGPWRNFYLTGAQELRNGVPDVRGRGMGSRIDFIRAMTVDMIFDAFGTRLDGPPADGLLLAINWRFTDTREAWVLRVEHGALHHWPAADPAADVTVTLARSTLDEIVAQTTTIDEHLAAGSIIIDGDAAVLVTFFGLLETPSLDFAIVEP